MKRLIAVIAALALCIVAMAAPPTTAVVMTGKKTSGDVATALERMEVTGPDPAEFALYLRFVGTCSGTVAVETASASDYTGTWATLATVTVAAVTDTEYLVQVTGALAAVRVRLTSDITGGGSLTVYKFVQPTQVIPER